MRKTVVLLAAAGSALAISGAAAAHNSAHFFLGDRCIQLGSQNEAPIVGAGNPHQTAGGQLDLVPGPGDQYGARLAADQSARLLPGDCPVAP